MGKETFWVDVWEEQSGKMEIKANNKEEAEKEAERILNEIGITNENTNVSHRACNLI